MSCTFKYLTTTLLIELHGYSKICYKNEPGTRKVELRMKTLSKHPSKNTVTINVLQLFAFITTLRRKRAFFYLYLNSHRAHFSVFLMKIPSKPALKNIEITMMVVFWEYLSHKIDSNTLYVRNCEWRQHTFFLGFSCSLQSFII